MNEKALEIFKQRGYTEEHRFPGEYLLLVNPKNLSRVRLYENGRVWAQRPSSGEYVNVTSEFTEET